MLLRTKGTLFSFCCVLFFYTICFGLLLLSSVDFVSLEFNFVNASLPLRDNSLQNMEKPKEVYHDDEGNEITKSAFKKLQKDKEKAQKKKEVEERLAKEKEKREQESERDCAEGKYGSRGVCKSQGTYKKGTGTLY